MDELMPIGEFSQRSGLSQKRLRAYAAGGLLVPAAVDSASGYRYYAPGQVREAQLIDALRDAGMPLSQIASVLRQRSIEQLDRWARQVDAEAAQRHDAVRLARQLLASTDDHGRKDVMSTLHAAARTDVGRVRGTNEDATICGNHLVAVADGMGGAPGGEVASATAVALLEAAFSGRSLDELEAAVRAANRAIFDAGTANPSLEGMGTTICAVGLTAVGELAVVHVGDSRAYLLTDGSLQPLTEDHSVTAELVRQGELSEQEAAEHPYRNVLTRAVGAAPTVEVDGSVHRARPGDRVVLCSDGLFNEVGEDDIAELASSTSDLHAAAGALVDRAVSNGGRDNVTVVIAEICEAPGTIG